MIFVVPQVEQETEGDTDDLDEKPKGPHADGGIANGHAEKGGDEMEGQAQQSQRGRLTQKEGRATGWRFDF